MPETDGVKDDVPATDADTVGVDELEGVDEPVAVTDGVKEIDSETEALTLGVSEGVAEIELVMDVVLVADDV